MIDNEFWERLDAQLLEEEAKVAEQKKWLEHDVAEEQLIFDFFS